MRMCGSADIVTSNLRSKVAGKICGCNRQFADPKLQIQNCGYYIDLKFCVSSASGFLQMFLSQTVS